MKVVDAVAEELQAIGLEPGDHVLVRVSGRRMTSVPRDVDGGKIESTGVLLEALLDVVGNSGTVMALTFTRGWRLRHPKGRIGYTLDSEPLTGKFPKAVLSHPQSKRSTHPTSSVAAVGAFAEDFTRFHTPHSHCFRPVEDLLLADGKMLLVGCTEESPGFSTVHVAQFHLGLSERSLLSHVITTSYQDDFGQSASFRKRDVPGCSMGFGKMYPRYRAMAALSEGRVGGADSMLISARDAYRADFAALREDPTSVLCEDPSCATCRATLTYNKGDWLPYWKRRLTGTSFRRRAI